MPPLNVSRVGLCVCAMLSLPLGVRPVALRLRGGAVGSSARRLRAAAESDGPTAPSSRQRGDAALPEFRHCHWRINASRAPGAWPGPATTFLFPTDEELNEFGNGKAYPGADGENVTLEEFVMDLSTHLGLLPVTSEECITRLCYVHTTLAPAVMPAVRHSDELLAAET